MSLAPQAMRSCRVQSEGVKNESNGLQETGLPATRYRLPGPLVIASILILITNKCYLYDQIYVVRSPLELLESFRCSPNVFQFFDSPEVLFRVAYLNQLLTEYSIFM